MLKLLIEEHILAETVSAVSCLQMEQAKSVEIGTTMVLFWVITFLVLQELRLYGIV
jgi:hypothetical protein